MARSARFPFTIGRCRASVTRPISGRIERGLMCHQLVLLQILLVSPKGVSRMRAPPVTQKMPTRLQTKGRKCCILVPMLTLLKASSNNRRWLQSQNQRGSNPIRVDLISTRTFMIHRALKNLILIKLTLNKQNKQKSMLPVHVGTTLGTT